eukprot:XP_014784343.1 PREDICTED: uncharacterized protein LOC106879348 [Octopus bimaculoides]
MHITSCREKREVEAYKVRGGGNAILTSYIIDILLQRSQLRRRNENAQPSNIFSSILVQRKHGTALFNIVPKQIKEEKDPITFKRNLDNLLQGIPPMPGYNSLNMNSLLKWTMDNAVQFFPYTGIRKKQM